MAAAYRMFLEGEYAATSEERQEMAKRLSDYLVGLSEVDRLGLIADLLDRVFVLMSENERPERGFQ